MPAVRSIILRIDASSWRSGVLIRLHLPVFGAYGSGILSLGSALANLCACARAGRPLPAGVLWTGGSVVQGQRLCWRSALQGSQPELGEEVGRGHPGEGKLDLLLRRQRLHLVLSTARCVVDELGSRH